jgi:uncharacterized delta-60 repeat protein
MRRFVEFAACLCLVAFGAAAAAEAIAPGQGLTHIVEPSLPPQAAMGEAGIADLADGSGSTVYGALAGQGTGGGYFGAVALAGGETPEASFGEGGFTGPLKLPFGGFDNLSPQAEALAVQGDGKLVVVGSSREGVREPVAFAPLLVRYRADGSLDPSFSGDGIIGKAPQARGGSQYHDVAVTRKGTILVAGGRDEEGVGGASPAGVLVAYRADGTPETSFGEHGRVFFKSGPADYYATLRAVQVLPSGKILVAGYLDSELLLARLTAGGRLDHTFGGGDGEVTLNLHDHFCCEEAALALAPGGRIVVAGMGGSLAKYRVFLARYLPSGRPDRGFGDRGVEAAARPRRLGTLLALAVERNGKIVTVGRTEISPANRYRAFAVFRNLSSGKPDRGFGKGGLYVLRRGAESIAHATLTLPGGTLVGGSLLNMQSAGSATTTGLLLARLSG